MLLGALREMRRRWLIAIIAMGIVALYLSSRSREVPAPPASSTGAGLAPESPARAAPVPQRPARERVAAQTPSSGSAAARSRAHLALAADEAPAPACGVECVPVSGTVLDASGGAIAGARVRASDSHGALLATAVSSGAGTFRLSVAPGLTRISAGADGYSEQLEDILAPIGGLRLVLAAESAIAGRVVIEGTQQPVAGAVVTAVSEEGLPTEPRATRTTADGAFRVSGLSAGRYSLAAVARSWRSDSRTLVVGVAETVEPIELSVRRAIPIHGVVQVDGAPCERGSVAVQGAVRLYSQLAPDGSVLFDGVPPGRYDVEVNCAGALAQSDELDVGHEPLERVWELERGLELRGVALSPAATPLAGAEIEVSPVGEPHDRGNTSCVTNERGEFSCSGLQPGAYECIIASSGPPRSERVRVTLSAESAPPLVLHAHPEGAIRVRLEGTRDFELRTLALMARGPRATLLGELRGDEVVFEPVALGSYEVALESAPPGSGRRVELSQPGQLVQLSFELPAPHTLSGRVVDESGQGLPDTWVRVHGTSPYAQLRPSTPVLTDAEGAFSVLGLVPARYQLHASKGALQAELDEVASDSRDVTVTLASARPAPIEQQ